MVSYLLLTDHKKQLSLSLGHIERKQKLSTKQFKNINPSGVASSPLLAKFKDFSLAPSFKASYQGPPSIDHTLQSNSCRRAAPRFLSFQWRPGSVEHDGEVAQQAGSDSFLLPTKGSSFPGRCCWPPPFSESLVGPIIPNNPVLDIVKQS